LSIILLYNTEKENCKSPVQKERLIIVFHHIQSGSSTASKQGEQKTVMKQAYRKQTLKPSVLDPRPQSVLDAYYRRPLYDADQWKKRSLERKYSTKQMASKSRLDPSSSNYGRFKYSLQHSPVHASSSPHIGHASYDHPADFDYIQYEVDEYKRMEIRRAQERTNNMLEEELHRKRRAMPVYITSPIKVHGRRRKKGHGKHVPPHQQQLQSNNNDNGDDDDEMNHVDRERERRLRLQRARENKKRLIEMSKPKQSSLDAAAVIRTRIQHKRRGPSSPPPSSSSSSSSSSQALNSANLMSKETLDWIEKSSKAKTAKMKTLGEFQERLNKSRQLPTYSNRSNITGRLLRPTTVSSPLREAWIRSASTPKRIATPYRSTNRGNGAFGCTGSRLPERSTFELDIGPGQYGIVDNPNNSNNCGSCKFNLSTTKNVIDQEIFNKRHVSHSTITNILPSFTPPFHSLLRCS
jgi:hypothetical protein